MEEAGEGELEARVQPAPPPNNATGMPSVVGSLQQRWRAWEAMGASEEVVAWIRDGLPVTPLEGGKLGGRRWQYDRVEPGEQSEWTDKEIERLVRTGALEDLGVSEEMPEGISEVSPIRLAPKAGPKRFRLVVNMRRLNAQLPVKSCHYEGVKEVRRMLTAGSWAFTFDLREGYFHHLVRVCDRRWLGIRWKGRWYRYRVLPFGLCWAPFYFTKAMREVIKFWRSKGICVLAFLDDVIVSAPSRELLFQVREQIAHELKTLGWQREESKGQWEPTQRVKFLGLIFDTALERIFIPEEKVDKLKSQLQVLSTQQSMTARQVARVSGLVISVSLAFAPARLFSRALYRVIKEARVDKWNWDSDVKLDDAARREVRWLLENVDRFNGALIWRPSLVEQVWTDASSLGWGAHHPRSGSRAGGLWTPQEQRWHINVLEARAMRLAFLSFRSLLSSRFVEFVTDSMVAAANMNKGGGPAPLITAEVQRSWLCAAESGTEIVGAQWVPRELNTYADRESKYVDTSDWVVQDQVFAWAEKRWGPHTCDLFAGADSHKCTTFFSERWQPGAAGVNAFAQDWSRYNGWAVPPLALIPRVLAHVSESHAQVTILVPHWPAQPWWPMLLRLMVEYVEVGYPSEVVQVGLSGHCELLSNPRWRLWLVRVGTSRS